MDGVQALDERMSLFMRQGRMLGYEATIKIISTAISAYERYQRGEFYKPEAQGGGVKALQKRALSTWLDAANLASL